MTQGVLSGPLRAELRNEAPASLDPPALRPRVLILQRHFRTVGGGTPSPWPAVPVCSLRTRLRLLFLGGEERRVPSESGAWLGCHLRSGGGSPTAPLSCPTSEGHVWGDSVGSHCKNRPRGAGAAGTPHQQAHARAAASLSDGPQMLSRSSWEETGPIKPNTLANGEKDERDRQRVSRSRAGLHTSLPSRSAHIALTVRNKICPLQN